MPAPTLKLLPYAWSVKGGSPAVALVGAIRVSTGGGGGGAGGRSGAAGGRWRRACPESPRGRVEGAPRRRQHEVRGADDGARRRDGVQNRRRWRTQCEREP